MSIYLFYGIKHSKENPDSSEDRKEAGYVKLDNIGDED